MRYSYSIDPTQPTVVAGQTQPSQLIKSCGGCVQHTPLVPAYRLSYSLQPRYVNQCPLGMDQLHVLCQHMIV